MLPIANTLGYSSMIGRTMGKQMVMPARFSYFCRSYANINENDIMTFMRLMYRDRSRCHRINDE